MVVVVCHLTAGCRLREEVGGTTIDLPAAHRVIGIISRAARMN